MKLLNKYIFMSFVASLAFAACSDDYNYSVGKPAAGGEEVYFSEDVQDNSNVVMALTDNVIKVTVVRNNSNGSVTAPITSYASNEGVFTVPSTVTFASGEKEATIEITTSEAMKPFVTYSLSLIVGEEYTNPYKENNLFPRADLSILKEDYVVVYNGTYSSGFFGEEWENVIEYSELNDLYRIKNSKEIEDYDEDGELIGTQLCTLSFTFTWDKETNVLELSDDAYSTGYEYDPYGLVTANYDPEGDFIYDPETNTFVFGFEWTVSAGSFGVAEDSFIVAE